LCTMSQKAIISFEKLTKYYKNHIGIKDLNFKVYPGEIFGFLGPNGAGKTTTIRLMLDLLKPSSGMVKIFGKEVHSHSYVIRQKIGYLPGDFSPFEKMTAYEFLKFSFNLRKIDIPMPEKLFSMFNLSDKELQKKIREYSQGMKQKLGIIHAIAHKPPLIILDEPSTGLDPIMQDKLYEILIDINKEGSTVFFSSHNLPEVEKICKKVAIVKNGILVGNESLESLRKKKYRKLILSLYSDSEKPPNLKDAKLIKSAKNEYEYIITGDINLIIQQLSNFRLKNVIFPEPDLEEIFMSYYEGGLSG